MTYIPQNTITVIPADSQLDAFARQRVSTPYTLFDSKQLFDSAPLYFDDQQVSGSGTSSSHNPNRASTLLSVTGTTAGKRVRQTFQRFNYQPGKAQVAVFTFTMGTNGAGVLKEVGLFDNNNGVFFRMDGTTPKFVIRSYTTGSPVDTEIPQSSWSEDKLDGTGESGLTADFTKSQILFLDYEWLGVGSVRFGFFIGGKPILCHKQLHANSVSAVYMSSPNLPIRYSIENDGTGGALSFEHICTTVYSDGGIEQTGTIRSIDRGVSGYVTGNNSNIHPILSLRLKSTHIGAVIEMLNFAVLVATESVDFRYAVYFNPTVAGTDNASWTSIPNSAIEYDITRDNTNTLSGGTLILSGYGSDIVSTFSGAIDSTLRIGSAINGTRDQIVLAIQNISGNTETYYGTLTWQELL